MSKAIEDAISRDDWPAARRLIRTALRREPTSHWLLTRLGLTYYEQRDYRRSLDYSKRALRLAPFCPLVLWDYAGDLQMLGRHADALRVYSRLIRRGVDALAFGRCGEGHARARGLVADCYYRQADSYEALGQRAKALRALESYLDMRGPGCHSIYQLGEATRRASHLRKARGRSNKRLERTGGERSHHGPGPAGASRSTASR